MNRNYKMSNHKSHPDLPSGFTSKEKFCNSSGVKSGADLSFKSGRNDIQRIFLRKPRKSVFGKKCNSE